MANNAITSRDVDFAKWYTDVVMAAHLASYTNVKGCIAIEPNGYAIWEKMQEILDKKFKELGHVNVQMPLLIPENLLKKEGELVEGFAPEVAWVTHGGSKELDERLCIRPTSETMFSDYYKDHVSSYRDLPKLYNQWCNVLRWEKETRPFLRSREFLWQEGHTIHETEKEAMEETDRMMDVYKWFHHEILAIPSITGRKTEKEKFAGAEYTITNEALMYNGVALQAGTSHYFGQKFSKAYDIKFSNRENKLEYVYQTSWGTTTRMIGGLIMVHSDEAGLVLPPKIAPTQVAIIPIGMDDEVNSLCNKYEEMRDEINLKIKVYKETLPELKLKVQQNNEKFKEISKENLKLMEQISELEKQNGHEVTMVQNKNNISNLINNSFSNSLVLGNLGNPNVSTSQDVPNKSSILNNSSINDFSFLATSFLYSSNCCSFNLSRALVFFIHSVKIFRFSSVTNLA